VIAGISFGEINLASRRSAAGDTGRFQIDRPLQGAPGHVTPSMRCIGRNGANTTAYPKHTASVPRSGADSITPGSIGTR
jgi:hypothetical protein